MEICVNLFIVDPEGLALDVAVLALSQGHEVKHFIADTVRTRRIGESMVNRVRSIGDNCRWADVVFIADNMKYMPTLEACRQDKACVAVWVGPCKATSQLEHDRELGQNIMEQYGVPTAPYKAFSDYDEAIAYVKKRDTRMVSKPFGSDNKALSYVAKGPDDLIFMLKRWSTQGKFKGQFILQDFVPGIEVAVGGWFDGEGFNSGFHENFEFKKLMNDDIGPNTGEQGTILQVLDKSRLAELVLLPFQPLLKAHKYVGYFDTNCIVDAKGTPYPLEFTVRPGWPTTNLQLSLIKGDFVESLCTTSSPQFHRGRTCAGVVFTIPDYPYSHITRKEVTGIPVWGFDADNLHYHPCEMLWNDKNGYCTAGDYVACITGHGRTVVECTTNAYKNLKKLTLPNSPMYRTDIGKKLEKELPKLQKFGLATAFKYA
jgi:phosphoribosylamine---glycine ligase